MIDKLINGMEKRTIFVFKGILFNKENQILIVNRKEEILDDANGKWEIPGGKLEFGETPEETVKRELLEETGYNVEVKTIIPYTKTSMWEYSTYLQHTVLFFYICEMKDEKHIKIKDTRINTYKWITEEELPNYSFLPGNKEAIAIAIKTRKDH